MADHGHHGSQETAYGCRTHYRFRHPDTREWRQVTRLEVAHVEQAFRYCGLRWNVHWVACDQCQEGGQALAADNGRSGR